MMFNVLQNALFILRLPHYFRLCVMDFELLGVRALPASFRPYAKTSVTTPSVQANAKISSVSRRNRYFRACDRKGCVLSTLGALCALVHGIRGCARR